MAKRSSGGRKSLNTAIREYFRKVPDPLHFELPHTHKKLLEALYAIAIIGTVICIMLLNYVGLLSISEANASLMLVIILVVVLGFFLIEKSMVAHKPGKASS